MKGTYRSEIEGMIDFYTEIGYDGKVDYSCSTDGRLMIGNDCLVKKDNVIIKKINKGEKK